jgi:hypothetical protein
VRSRKNRESEAKGMGERKNEKEGEGVLDGNIAERD